MMMILVLRGAPLRGHRAPSRNGGSGGARRRSAAAVVVRGANFFAGGLACAGYACAHGYRCRFGNATGGASDTRASVDAAEVAAHPSWSALGGQFFEVVTMSLMARPSPHSRAERRGTGIGKLAHEV